MTYLTKSCRSLNTCCTITQILGSERLNDRDPPQTETPWTETPLPWTETPLPWTETPLPWTETPLDRDAPPDRDRDSSLWTDRHL